MKKLVKALFSGLCTIVGVSLICFLLTWLAPGDPAEVLAVARYGFERGADPEIVSQVREANGLDKPLMLQYIHWLTNVLTLDFGISLLTNVPVTTLFMEGLKDTLALSVLALLMSAIVSVLFAFLAAWRPGSLIDRTVMALAILGSAVPGFWLGLLLILWFAVKYAWFPTFGNGSFLHLVLPAVTLSVYVVAETTRILRVSLISAKKQPFLPALRLRGISSWEINLRHVMHHALIHFLTMFLLQVAIVLEGAVVVEVTFARNGLGSLLVKSVLAKDFPVIQILVMFSAVLFVSASALARQLNMLVDKRSQL